MSESRFQLRQGADREIGEMFQDRIELIEHVHHQVCLIRFGIIPLRLLAGDKAVCVYNSLFENYATLFDTARTVTE